MIPSHISHFFIPCFSLSCLLPAPSLIPAVDEHNAGTRITLVPSDLGPNHRLCFTLPLKWVNTLTVVIHTFQLILSAVFFPSFKPLFALSFDYSHLNKIGQGCTGHQIHSSCLFQASLSWNFFHISFKLYF